MELKAREGWCGKNSRHRQGMGTTALPGCRPVVTWGCGTPGAPCSTRLGSPRGPGLWELTLLGRLEEKEQEPQEGAGPAPAALCIVPKVGVVPQAPQDITRVDPGASSTFPGEQLRDTENPSAVRHHCWSGLLGHWGQEWSRLLGRQGHSELLLFH